MSERGPNRPALTALCEGVLLRILRHSRAENAQPLSTVPRHILAVKVHWLGDSVIVRSILEHLRYRNPDIEISVLAESVKSMARQSLHGAIHGQGGCK